MKFPPQVLILSHAWGQKISMKMRKRATEQRAPHEHDFPRKFFKRNPPGRQHCRKMQVAASIINRPNLTLCLLRKIAREKLARACIPLQGGQLGVQPLFSLVDALISSVGQVNYLTARQHEELRWFLQGPAAGQSHAHIRRNPRLLSVRPMCSLGDALARQQSKFIARTPSHL